MYNYSNTQSTENSITDSFDSNIRLIHMKIV